MICANCGRNNPEGARFCDGCGSTMPVAGANGTAPPMAQPQYQQTYQTPPYNQQQSTSATTAEVLSIGQYIGMLILGAIPIVGFILILVWAFGGSVNPNKSNWARAMLIMMVIGIVLSIILSVALGSLATSLLNSLNYS